MSSGLLPDHIEPLVDRLRSGDHLPIALPDVAAVTEILMRSLESYFKSIDLTLYKECQDLADYINDARSEISSLSPNHDDSAGIPRAGQELDAIVEATESATDTIMQAAEDLMSFDNDDFDEYKNHTNEQVMKIFEACSFQDITGQRISKVVGTLNHVEDRVGKLISILGVTSNDLGGKGSTPIVDPDTGELNEAMSDDDLLNGPALAGEGIDQSEIDSLLDDFDGPAVEDDSPAEEADAPAVEDDSPAEEADAPAEPAEVKEDTAAAETEKEEAKASPSPESNDDDASSDEDEDEDDKETSQKDIDSLFG